MYIYIYMYVLGPHNDELGMTVLSVLANSKVHALSRLEARVSGVMLSTSKCRNFRNLPCILRFAFCVFVSVFGVMDGDAGVCSRRSLLSRPTWLGSCSHTRSNPQRGPTRPTPTKNSFNWFLTSKHTYIYIYIYIYPSGVPKLKISTPRELLRRGGGVVSSPAACPDACAV